MCPTRGPMARGAREDILDIPGNLAQVRISQNSFSKFHRNLRFRSRFALMFHFVRHLHTPHGSCHMGSATGNDETTRGVRITVSIAQFC